MANGLVQGKTMAAPQEELLIEWPEGRQEPCKYWLSSLPPHATSLRRLARTAKGCFRMEQDYEEMKRDPIVREPRLVAETIGPQEMEVFQGDYTHLHTVLPDTKVLAAIDLFEKKDMTATTKIMGQWREHVSGEVFIP